MVSKLYVTIQNWVARRTFNESCCGKIHIAPPFVIKKQSHALVYEDINAPKSFSSLFFPTNRKFSHLGIFNLCIQVNLINIRIWKISTQSLCRGISFILIPRLSILIFERHETKHKQAAKFFVVSLSLSFRFDIYLINSGNINSCTHGHMWGFFSFFERIFPISYDMNSMFREASEIGRCFIAL